eukprot:5002743-Pyramimonas_sp.AAC.1
MLHRPRTARPCTTQSAPEGGDHHQPAVEETQSAMNINFWRPVRISWICAGPPLPAARSAPGAAPVAPPGGGRR